MAHRKISQEEKLNRLLMGEISKGMAVQGETSHDLCNLLDICPATLSNRRKRPGEFSLTDFRRLARHYGWTKDIIADLVGIS